MPLSRHSVGTYQENELTRNSSGNAPSQSSQLAEPLWTDPGLMSGISLHNLISTLKKKERCTWGMNYWTFSKTPCNMREKPPPLPCLWWSILTTLVVHHILRSEELALFAIFWWGKPLLGWYVLSFSAVWTTASLCSLTSPLIKCTVPKYSKSYSKSRFSQKQTWAC